jgi:hypothetical protein
MICNRVMTYEFLTDCVSCRSGQDITDMVDSAREITRKTFLSHCNVPPELLRLIPAKEPYVSFHKSKFKGQSCYYFEWSRIEHVFTNQQGE